LKKKIVLLLLVSLLPACYKKKCQVNTCKKQDNCSFESQKNDQIFSEDAQEFILEDDSDVNVFENGNQEDNDDIFLDTLDEEPEKAKTIQFDYNSSKIRNSEDLKIKENAKSIKDKLKNNNNTKVICKGHSCKIAKNKEYNYTLSQERAHRIATKYKQNGIPSDKIKAVGFGDSNRITEAEGLEGQAPNRRVETTFLNE